MSNTVSASWSAREDELLHNTGRALLFLAGNASYAVSVDFVERVIESPALVPVPRSSNWLTGLAVYDSVPLPLIDLQLFFAPQTQTGAVTALRKPKRSVVVSCAHGKALLGVEQLITIADLSTRKRVETGRAEFPSQYIEFACEAEGSIVGVISIPRLLSGAGIEQVDQHNSAGVV